jgi:hypothetical protein
MDRIALTVMLAGALVVGCGDDSDAADDGSGRDGGGSNVGDEISKTIEAAEGGEVELDGAAVDIPADALSEDVEITIEVLDKDDLPESDSIASAVYDFGPDGTIFDEPVTLAIDFDASATPDGMRAVLAWLDTENDEWQPLADSQVRGDSVTATTDHFTPFAVIFTADGQTAGQCDELGETDCGGDLDGTWEFSLGCVTLPPDFLENEDGESPFGECPGLTLAAVLDLTGTITFDEGDGSYALDTMQSIELTITAPKSCLPMGAACDDLGDEETPVTDTGDACEIVQTQEMMDDETGTYEIDGNTVITTNDLEMMADEPNEYCIRGDTLTVKSTSDDGAVTVFQATRQ